MLTKMTERRRLIICSDRHSLKRPGQPAAQSELATRPGRCPLQIRAMYATTIRES
jgi:hypothetical protein